MHRVFFAVTGAALAAHALHSGLGWGGEGLDPLFNDFVFNALILAAAGACAARAWLGHELHRSERLGWLMFGVGIACWGAGEIHYSLVLADDPSPPFPTIGDAFYIGFYPACYAGLMLLVRARVRRFHTSLWLDGAIGALAIAALGAALIFDRIVESTSGDATTVAVNLAYPLGDLLLLSFVVGVFALLGWRPGAGWLLIGAGLAASAVADAYYLDQVARGTYEEGTIFDSFWPAGSLLLAYAAWQPPSRGAVASLEGWRILFAPALFAAIALGVQLYGYLGSIHPLAWGLASAALLAVIVRMALTHGEYLGLLKISRHQALTDSLTGLGNRRRLMEDLEELLDGDLSKPTLLLALDLDGFKEYNDLYGHPVGDQLLARLGRKLGEAAASYGRAYRPGGDEFCVLASLANVEAEPIVTAALRALSDRGDGFEVSCSHGMVALPAEAAEPGVALRIADHRLYVDKENRRRRPAPERARDPLMTALTEPEPGADGHMRSVTDLATAVGHRLGLPPEEMEALTQAAELHDIGKMAVPRALLLKPSSLDEQEWVFLRQHPSIGERILSAAPALMPVARRVRSTHERWDGGGYPDALTSDTIPLSSRIVAVCDAFQAMTSERPYRGPRPAEEALAELRRCAGSQFDPEVVEAFADVIAREGLIALTP